MIESQTRQADWRRANPMKYNAHLAVQRAIVAGDLEKLGCEVCGHDAVDAHHDEYDEPLRVRCFAADITRVFIATAKTCFHCGRIQTSADRFGILPSCRL